LSATESNSDTLKRAQTAEIALGRTRLFGLWSRRPRVRVPSLTPWKPLLTRGFSSFRARASNADRVLRGDQILLVPGQTSVGLVAMAPMSRRSNGAGTVFIKHGDYYGRWYTPDGGALTGSSGRCDGLARPRGSRVPRRRSVSAS
jgi:hypothetical protein